MIKTSKRLVAIHDKSKKDFEAVVSEVRDERQQCLDDRRFYSIAGAQYEGPLEKQYENKPKIEVNKIHLAVIRIINEYRNNRITVDFAPKTPKDDNLADLLDGLYRADEHDSEANEAYDNAFEEAVGGGFGAWRLRADYEDEYDSENEYQRIKIEPIFDADSSVYFDIDAKRQDKKDAKQCWVLSSMSPEAYKEEWGDDVSTWDKAVSSDEFDWSTNEKVYVAEHYKVEEVSKSLTTWTHLDGEEEQIWEDDLDEDTLTAQGSVMTKTRKVKTRKVHKYIESGAGVLEDCGYIAGREIPIIPVYGKRWFVDGIERCMGQVRLAKDAQRLQNMQLSKLAEVSAYTQLEKPIFLEEQMEGHAGLWADDHVVNNPYLLVNPVQDAEGNLVPTGPIAYTKPMSVPASTAALLQITSLDLNEVLGGPQGGDKIVSNISEETVGKIHERLDMQTFIYMSNLAKSMKRSGEVWLSMAKELYVEDDREMKIVGKEGDANIKALNQPSIDEQGEKVSLNDLSYGEFDVNVEVGPSSSSKRNATVNAITGLLQFTTDPEMRTMLEVLAIFNMEGEGMKGIRELSRKRLVRLGASDPTEEDKAEMQAEQEAQTDPNADYLEAAAAKERAGTVETIASAELKKAQAEKAQADIINNQEKLKLEQQKLILDSIP